LELAALHPLDPALTASIPATILPPADRESALRELIRGRLECLGPVRPLALTPDDLEQTLTALETQGFAVRGHFDPDLAGEQWCERRLLACINRYRVENLRREIAPASPAAYMRFLLT